MRYAFLTHRHVHRPLGCSHHANLALNCTLSGLFANVTPFFSLPISHDAFEFVSGTALLLGGAMPFAWHLAGTFLPRMGMAPATHPIAHSLVFFTGITLFGFVTDLPWSYARAFWLEERHGFNNQVRVRGL